MLKKTQKKPVSKNETDSLYSCGIKINSHVQ